MGGEYASKTRIYVMQDLFILAEGLAGGLRTGCPGRHSVVPGQLAPMECDIAVIITRQRQANLRCSGCRPQTYDYLVL